MGAYLSGQLQRVFTRFGVEPTAGVVIAVSPGDPPLAGYEPSIFGERWPSVDELWAPADLPGGSISGFPLAPGDPSPYRWWCALPTDEYYSQASQRCGLFILTNLIPIFWPFGRLQFLDYEHVGRESNLARKAVINSVPDGQKESIRRRISDYYEKRRDEVEHRYPQLFK